MKSHPVQCFYGQQVKATSVAQASEEITESGNKVAYTNSGSSTASSAVAQVLADADNSDILDAQVVADVAAETTDSPSDEANIFLRSSHKRYNAHHAHVPSDENDQLIELINELDIGWKADTCKYQKHHNKYGAHCDKKTYQPLRLAQTEGSTFGQGPEFKKAHAEALKFQKKYSTADQIPDSELPENFDWRNVGGFDFTNEHRNQGHCGSCYTVSFTQIAEQRLKLKYGKEIPLLSPQFLMTCNYMNEGCDGGWPFFHGYLAEKGHLVTEECAPYKGQTKGDSCSNYSGCEPFAKVKSTYFVGRGYGDTTEKKMMKEILRNGIVNGELQAPSIFSMYTEGIMTQDGIQKLHKKIKSLAQIRASEESDKVEITNKTLKDYGLSWQNLNHSVVIIGWGVDEVTNMKYWIVRNSYGSTWGDHGEFLVQRGTDDFGIESETTGYEYVLCSEGGC